jgi:uncharacterized OB-fold protein
MPSSSSVHSIDEFRRDYEEGVRLRGFRSRCGFVTATWGLVCPQCGQRDLAEAQLSGHGRLVAFTVQNVPGEEFLNDAPYAYVVVELDEGGQITGWIDGIRSESDLHGGQRVAWAPTYKPGVHFRLEQSSSSGAT